MIQEPLAGLLELENTSQELEAAQPDEIPIAVNLGDRALALEAIMAYYNQASRVGGMASVINNSRSSFYSRYGEKREDVYQRAKARQSLLHEGFQTGIATLGATGALAANEYDEADIDLEYRRVQSQLNRELGVGSGATAKDRKKIVEAAKRSVSATTNDEQI